MAVAARREVVHELKATGLSERTALKLVGISTSVLRYRSRDDGNSKSASCASASKISPAGTAATAIACCMTG